MRLVLAGFGVVGQNLARLFLASQPQLKEAGIHPRIVAIADRSGTIVHEKGLRLDWALEAKRRTGKVRAYPGACQKMEFADAIAQVAAEAVVEAIPSNYQRGEPGYSYIVHALKAGKHVVTTDKPPLALHMPALLELAQRYGRQLRFSGTVGGGMPILEVGKRCLRGDRIVQCRGILNGTTNYILTRMANDGMSLEKALEQAKQLGYAEANPEVDLSGLDAAAKLVIIANYLMSKGITLPDVKVRGIQEATLRQIQEARRRGEAIKLLGSVNGAASVAPTSIPVNDPVCVHDNLNAVEFTTEFAGKTVVIGKGAGGMETASAIVRDLIALREEMLLKP